MLRNLLLLLTLGLILTTNGCGNEEDTDANSAEESSPWVGTWVYEHNTPDDNFHAVSTLELMAGGQFRMTSTATSKNGRIADTEEKIATGEWKEEGQKITLTALSREDGEEIPERHRIITVQFVGPNEIEIEGARTVFKRQP